MSTTPSVLFVCVKNGGKSQMAAALMRALAGDRVEVHSAGTAPGGSLNSLSAQAVSEVGASMQGGAPMPVDPEVLARVDRVVVLGHDAQLAPIAGMRGQIEVWETDEPLQRGIEGMERMRLVRDAIDVRVHGLYRELLGRRVIRVFEPALCCNTGVCGPDLDESLVAFTADLDFLAAAGVDIVRHNLANDPSAFAHDPTVAQFLRVAGSAGLPLTLVDGVTVATGTYPTRARLAELAGLPTPQPAPGDQEPSERLSERLSERQPSDLALTASTSCCAPATAGSGSTGCC